MPWRRWLYVDFLVLPAARSTSPLSKSCFQSSSTAMEALRRGVSDWQYFPRSLVSFNSYFVTALTTANVMWKQSASGHGRGGSLWSASRPHGCTLGDIGRHISGMECLSGPGTMPRTETRQRYRCTDIPTGAVHLCIKDSIQDWRDQ